MTQEPTRHTALSRALHRLGDLTAAAWTAGVVAAVAIAWLIAYALAGAPQWMATVLQVAAAGVTLVMVFVIHHTQRRTEAAMQLKLDELIKASDADDRIAEIEHAGDELERLRHDQGRTG